MRVEPLPNCLLSLFLQPQKRKVLAEIFLGEGALVMPPHAHILDSWLVITGRTGAKHMGSVLPEIWGDSVKVWEHGFADEIPESGNIGEHYIRFKWEKS
jgi:hypothetical protein